MDYYRVLNVGRDASADEIESAYRSLAKRFQSSNGCHSLIAEEKFRQISEAHDILSDPSRRREYDRRNGFASHLERRRDEAVSDMGAPNLFQSPALKKWFAVDSARSETSRLRSFAHHYPASDIETTLAICFTEALSGCDKRIKVRRRGKAEEVVVQIPAGVADGQVLRFAGKGEMCSQGTSAGDLVVTVHIINDTVHNREGNDVIVHKTIRLSEAIMGTVVDVSTLGESFKVRVPAGTQPGSRLCIRGQGIYSSELRRRGDIYIQISVQVPDNLTQEQAQAVAALASLGL